MLQQETAEKILFLADMNERKFFPADVENGIPQLLTAAEEYARTYTGTFAFMVSLRESYEERGYLTFPQASGALNCIVADLRRKAAKEKEVAKAPVAPIAPLKLGIFTVVLNDGSHVTLKLTEGHGGFEGKVIFSSLFGPDNETDYAGFGHFDNGRLIFWKSRVTNPKTDRRSVAAYVLTASTPEEREEFGKAYAMESGRCYVCGRTLTDPVSIELGIGPICRENR